MSRIYPHLWYTTDAIEAAKLYTSIFPDSGVERVSSLPSDSPSGPAGSVDIVEFRLFGQHFQAMSAGPLDDFNHSISLVVECDDQEEIDRYWSALQEGGGTSEQCGWVCDRFGVRWQIVPTVLRDLITGGDRARAKRAADAMLGMDKLDIATLEAAAAGAPVS